MHEVEPGAGVGAGVGAGDGYAALEQVLVQEKVLVLALEYMNYLTYLMSRLPHKHLKKLL